MKANHDLARWFYRGGRPNRVAAVLNRFWAILSSAGLWPGRAALGPPAPAAVRAVDDLVCGQPGWDAPAGGIAHPSRRRAG